MTGEPILIIDDNELNLELLTLLFMPNAYTIRTASNAADALSLLETFTPRLILMDLQLPDMDGLQLTRKIRTDTKYQRTPIIVITARAMKGDKEKALAAGCNEYITKPINVKTLPTVIASYLQDDK